MYKVQRLLAYGLVLWRSVLKLGYKIKNCTKYNI
ncbi:hypothetical protein HMPREF9699_01653 [Bergeyella zoohelcum ATCC 43767]|uniref:Uncharacterized protein n=1 Tax=Bergeyella zoohelcum ATCC 43767 TaxID=883096 RepID=K1M0X4_9FLAO|nr:hypothetical protein HMPREF9699_01653 [Bergeyella zoohelcum ATCC 43767]SUV50268.1 Uncharacterised protein [Bergeyella zoohelcum]